MMQPSFCYITPTSYLDFTVASNTHLVLAHLVETDEDYASFYKLLSDGGDFIMMDNSAYELKVPYSPDKLVELGRKCGAHAIVLPDYPFQPAQKTIDAAEQFIPLFKAAGFKTFFVPQSEKGNLADWLRAYNWAANHNDVDIIGMSILGIPNAIPAIDPSFSRVVMTTLLQDWGAFNYNKHHHYLGLNAGPALEIPSLLRLKALTTIDSSGPVWAGILGHEYSTNADSYQAVRKLTVPVDFHAKRTKDIETLKRIRRNIDLTQQLFTNQVDRVWYAEE